MHTKENKLYLMLSSNVGMFAGCGSLSELWDFAIQIIKECGVNRLHHFMVKFEDEQEYLTTSNLGVYKFLRDFNNPKVINKFKFTFKKGEYAYIEYAADDLSFRIGHPSDFDIYNEDDKFQNIERIAPSNGIKKLKGFWYDQII